MISLEDVQAYPDKGQFVLDWPQPKSIIALWGFLGFTGYYIYFVRHYATIEGPLTDLLKRNVFECTPATIGRLKQAMTSMSILHLLDFSLPFQVDTDA